jgi:nucleoside-diphosphate-sugar epimerase
MNDTIKRALVTGGGGFLGGAIARLLQQRGVEVVSFSRQAHPSLTADGIRHYCGDLNDAAAVAAACAGCDAVFHVAAKAGVWGAYADYERANVDGTRHVIEACRRHHISRLIYTSSPSVVFHGCDMEGVDESVPYPEHYSAPYPQTKAIAERMVLAANDGALATVALRPHLIWGPGDQHLVPRIVARGQQGRLRRIGQRPCLVDTIYIDNAAEAHVLAAEYLHLGSAVAGKAYFISNGEPIPLWDMVNRILAAVDLPAEHRTVHPKVAYALGATLELLYRGFGVQQEPPMTRFVAEELSTAHWFNIDAARRDFCYRPRISIDEGIKRLATWLQTKSNNRRDDVR